MQPKSAVMLRVLLNRYHKGPPDALLGYLPGDVSKAVLGQDISSNDPLPPLMGPDEKIGRFHYSWLIPLVKNLPKDLQPLVIASLPGQQSSRLSHHLNISLDKKSVSLPIKTYLLNSLYNHLEGVQKVLPFEYIPKSNFSVLATWEKSQLVELIECLGLHDLSTELRQIVDQKTLKKVYTCLSPREQQYLRYCMHQKEKLVTPSLGLDRWSGDCAKLKAALQSRGLVRFGRALSGEHPDFLWYLVHVLDTGRGQALMKYYSRKPAAGITTVLAQQVLNLMNILKKKSEA